VQEYIDNFLRDLPYGFNMVELNARVKEKDPYINVCIQECERMNKLLTCIRNSLIELDAGL